MQIKTWNYEELVNTFSPQARLREVIQPLIAEISGAGSVMCDVEVDGRSCLDNPELQEETLAEAAFSQMTIKYSSLAQLFEATVVSVADHIQKILEYAPTVASELRGPQPGAALQEFESLIIHCQQTADMVGELKAALARLPDGRTRIGLWNSAEQQVAAVLKALLDTFEVCDLILTADLLEYELVSALESWREALEHEIKHRAQKAIPLGGNDSSPVSPSTAG